MAANERCLQRISVDPLPSAATPRWLASQTAALGILAIVDLGISGDRGTATKLQQIMKDMNATFGLGWAGVSIVKPTSTLAKASGSSTNSPFAALQRVRHNR